MTQQLIFAAPGNEAIAAHLAGGADKLGQFEMRTFPDGETYLRFISDVNDRDVTLVCTLSDPNVHALEVMFFAATARELGATRVGLVAPYLAYMRQDKRFHEGEAVTSRIFAPFLSAHVDWLVTVDPHLHRYNSLDEIYTIPSHVAHAAGPIAAWIKANVAQPVLIGPDGESEQWVKDVAAQAGAPFTVLTKIRHGDHDVEVSLPELDKYRHHTPVLVDDIISTARTMIETVKHLTAMGTKPPVCIGVHGVFAGAAYTDLQQSGVARIVTCNTIPHPSNGIDISGVLPAVPPA